MTERRGLSKFFQSAAQYFPKGFSDRLKWQYFGTLVAVVCGFVYTIMLARYFGSSTFGRMALALGVSTLSMQLFHANMRDFAIRYISEGVKAHESSTIGSAVALSIAVSVLAMAVFYGVFFAATDRITRALDQPADFSAILAITALTPILHIGISDVLTGTLRALDQVRDLAITMSGTAVLRVIATWVAIHYYSADLRTVLAVGAASLLVGATSYAILTIRYLHRASIPRTSMPAVRSFLEQYRPTGFLRRNYFINLLSIPTKELDTVVLGMLVPVEKVGIYRVARNFMNAIWSIADPLHLVIYPELARLWKSDSLTRVRGFLKGLMLGLGLVAILILLLGANIAPIAIPALAGTEFVASADLFTIMLASVVVWLPLIWIHPVFLASGRNDLSLRSAIIHSVSSAALLFALGYLAGTYGVAAGYSIGLTLLSVLQLYFLRRHRLLRDG